MDFWHGWILGFLSGMVYLSWWIARSERRRSEARVSEAVEQAQQELGTQEDSDRLWEQMH